MADPNVELLARVATALGDLRERVTFVGGCATALLITDPAAAPERATQDVDLGALQERVRDAVRCHFDEGMAPMPVITGASQPR